MSERKITTLECAGCTAPLSEAIVEIGVYRCPFCGYVNILPREEQSSEVMHYLYSGDAELKDYDFERAYNAYSKAAELDEKESKAYFGMALAANRIKYIKDIVNNRWQAICCEVTNRKFADDKNYLRALEIATPEQKEEYTSRAKEIDYIREKFAELEASGLDYDTFICVKVSDGQGGFTQDAVWANRLYDSISGIGAKPFYSEKEIGSRVGADYEALILYALYKSESMIIVCSNEEYLRTPWIQNEYTRYYAMMNEQEKLKNSIMIAFSGHTVERIPGIPGRIQGADLHSFDASQKIIEFVARFSNAEERARAEAEAKAKKERERKAKEDAQQKMLEELQKKLEKTDQKLQNGEVISTEEAKYCTSCGTKNDIDVKFCSSCGNTAFSDTNEKFCMSCKESNPIATKFCKSCGGKEFAHSLEELERILAEKAEAERKAKEKAEAERLAKEKTEAERLAKIQARKGWFKKYGILSLALVLLLAAVITTVIVISQQPKIVYEKVDGGYSVVGLKNYDKLDTVKIPSTHKGKPVVCIEYAAFRYCDSLTSVTIPDSVTSIGSAAFSGCTSLASVTIPDSVTSIGEYAFSNCYSLTSIAIPNSVTSIGDYAFYDCTSLKSIIVDDNNMAYKSVDGNLYTKDGKTLVQYATAKTETSFVTPSGVTTIGESAFSSCSALTNMIIPNSVTSIGDSAFWGCTSLTIYCEAQSKPIDWSSSWNCDCPVVWDYIGETGTTADGVKYEYISGGVKITDYTGSSTEIAIPSTINGLPVTSIENYAFRSCASLTSITVPDSVTTIGKYAFSGCTSLTSIVIPDSVTSIGGAAFNSCSALKNIIIPNSVTAIGNYAFSGCTSLTIYCEAQRNPNGWYSYWNSSDRPVVWGYKGN